MGVLLGLTAIVFGSAGPVSAEVVLCKSTREGSVQAREGSCKSGETEMTMAENADTIATEIHASVTPTSVTPPNVGIECDAHEDLYWVKENMPLN